MFGGLGTCPEMFDHFFFSSPTLLVQHEIGGGGPMGGRLYEYSVSRELDYSDISRHTNHSTCITISIQTQKYSTSWCFLGTKVKVF